MNSVGTAANFFLHGWYRSAFTIRLVTSKRIRNGPKVNYLVLACVMSWSFKAIIWCTRSTDCEIEKRYRFCPTTFVPNPSPLPPLCPCARFTRYCGGRHSTLSTSTLLYEVIRRASHHARILLGCQHMRNQTLRIEPTAARRDH